MVRLLCFLLALTTMWTHWCTAPGGARGSTPAVLSLTLATDKTTVLVGEPVRIRLRLENRGMTEVSGDFHLAYALDRVRILIAQDGGDFQPYRSRALALAARTKTTAEPVTIAPGAAVEALEFVSFDVAHADFAFPTAGNYRLRAFLLYDHYSQQLESNTVALSIVEPVGANRDALAFLRANDLEYLLTPEGSLFPMNAAALHQLKMFIDTFPGSAYAAYAQEAFDAICASSAGLDAVPADCPPLVFCVGDCGGDGTVMISDLVLGVSIALGNTPVRSCPTFDRSSDRQISIDELILAVTHALAGCPTPE